MRLRYRGWGLGFRVRYRNDAFFVPERSQRNKFVGLQRQILDVTLSPLLPSVACAGVKNGYYLKHPPALNIKYDDQIYEVY